MELDTAARAATQELLKRTAPDLPARYADLQSARRRRTVAKLVAVAAVVGLAAGGWQLLLGPTRSPEPTPQPVKVVNGALMALTNTTEWITVDGKPPAFHPRDIAVYANVLFTPDGGSAVYEDSHNRIVELDVTSGEERTLAPCPGTACWSSSLSPDGRLIALGADDGVELVHVGTGELEQVRPPGIGSTLQPTWSPDGTSLAFIGPNGLSVMAADGSDLRLVYPGGGRTSQLVHLSWSPDGTHLAFFEGLPIPHTRQGDVVDDRFTAMTLDLATGAVTKLHDAGHCYCLGFSPPSIAWSPDGDLIAVATTEGILGEQDARAAGVYTVHPDGTGWTRVWGGMVNALAWQPLAE